MDLQESSAAMSDILGLKGEPIAVKFYEAVPALDGFEIAGPRRYCQVLMGARQGQGLVLTADNIACPAAAWAFGFKEPPGKLSSGEMPAAMGIFGSPDAARHTLETMPRLPAGKYSAVACCPLSHSPFEPDVIVVEANPEQLMWIALATLYDTGGRLEFNTAILQATCVDATIVPALSHRVNASLGCYGCREATDLPDTDCIIGIPFGKLRAVVAGLQQLHERALPRVRSKTIYHNLLDRER